LPVLVALVLVQLPIAAAEPAPPVRQGMTPEEVRAALGKPQRIARQILYGRYQEMWTYEQPSLVRVEFNCLRGQPPHVINVHSGTIAKP
jgi:hypothetical protein